MAFVVNELGRLVIMEHLHVVLLCETRLKHGEMERVIVKLNFPNMIVVAAFEGDGRKRSGRLALL